METTDWLHALSLRELRPGTWTLEVIEELCRRLGSPERAVPCVHVAGSRGKGSACALLESAAREAGILTGLTTSPHLLSPRERIRVAGEPVSEERFLDLAERVRRIGAEELSAGYFEVMTAMAFVAFAEARVGLAIVETGLGGRVDATNVVLPLVAVITRLGMDHADRLGGTRESIAREKAGILKRGSRAVLGPNDAAVAAIVEQRARELGTPLRRVGPRDVARAPATALPGEVQRDNAATAMVALEELALAGASLAVTPEAMARGFASARWPARLQLLRGALGGVDLLLDVAHDVDGARALAAHGVGPVGAIVFSCLADKDLRGIGRVLLDSPALAAAEIVVPELPGSRARAADGVASELCETGLSARAAPSVERALQEAQSIASSRGGLVVAFGSFLVAGRVIEILRERGGPDPFAAQDCAISS